MIGAILVLLVVVVGFVVLRDLNRVEPQGPADAVSYQRSADYAGEVLGFEVLSPEELPDGWRATSVRFAPEPPRWHLGLLTEEGKYVGLEQARSSEQDMVTTYVDESPTRASDVTIEGKPWTSWTDEDGDRALVRSGPEVTTLVVGPVEQDVLVGFIKTLR